MKEEYIEKIYAGWLAKIIGIRAGAPIEGWSYERIKEVYGELDGYPHEYTRFAADDDSNGPLVFLRALEDGEGKLELSHTAVGEALLNYAPYEHGFFWWGGYGVSTEHTAYLNLRSGITAPRSGSIIQNGSTIAEQIGGQIFIDTWGLVCPNNPTLAAKYAATAASVTHDGNGIYGGIFIASCIACAFEEKNIRSIIEKGLSYIPNDSEYYLTVKAVMAFYDSNPASWRDCFAYIYGNFGYDKYPGNCHIIPNAAVIILALLYGEGDFDLTINICNMCGWDTDCNVGNVATIMGVIVGLDGIDYMKWRAPINDFLAFSTVIGSLNISDIPTGAAYITKLAYEVSKEIPLEPLKGILERDRNICHFEYPGSTHAFEVGKENGANPFTVVISNTDENAFWGKRSLKINASFVSKGDEFRLFKRTYLYPEDFDDSRYDPSFSPLIYPGQTINGSICLSKDSIKCTVRLYAKNARDNIVFLSEEVYPDKDSWVSLSYTIPSFSTSHIDEVGFAFEVLESEGELICFLDDVYFSGKAEYMIDFASSWEEYWTSRHIEIEQFTRLKGITYLHDGMLHLSCSDFAEMYTGYLNWDDYNVTFFMVPIIGTNHYVNFRVQGAIRSYAVGFSGNRLCLLKNENGYRMLLEIEYEWIHGIEYSISIRVAGNTMDVIVNGNHMFSYTDKNDPYLTGAIGVSVRDGSHCAYRSIRVE